jgi:hypothetical protein
MQPPQRDVRLANWHIFHLYDWERNDFQYKSYSINHAWNLWKMLSFDVSIMMLSWWQEFALLIDCFDQFVSTVRALFDSLVVSCLNQVVSFVEKSCSFFTNRWGKCHFYNLVHHRWFWSAYCGLVLMFFLAFVFGNEQVGLRSCHFMDQASFPWNSVLVSHQLDWRLR